MTQHFNNGSVAKYLVTHTHILQKLLNAMAAVEILPFIGVLNAHLNYVPQKKAIHTVSNAIVFHVINWNHSLKIFLTTNVRSRT
jgi:hypothetical protein